MNSLQSGGELNTNLRAYYDDSSGFRPESYDEPFEKKFFPDDKIKKKTPTFLLWKEETFHSY